MPIPDRWLRYKTDGKIHGTRFVAFKVPLKEVLCSGIPQNKRFTPKMVLMKYPKMKLVIDFTFTTKYYNGAKEFQENGVQYIKIMCPGHAIPTDALFKEFTEVVDSFLESNPEDWLIGIHCTHGVNRTGYFLVRYMIENLGYRPITALRAINVNDPTLRKIAQEINMAEMLLLQYLKEMTSSDDGAVSSQNLALDHLSHLITRELEYLRRVKNSEVVGVAGSFVTFRGDDGEFLVTVVPEEELQRNFHPLFSFSNIKPRFAKPVSSCESFAMPSPSAESVYYDACYDLPATEPPALCPGASDLGRSIHGLLTYIFASTIGKMDAANEPKH